METEDRDLTFINYKNVCYSIFKSFLIFLKLIFLIIRNKGRNIKNKTNVGSIWDESTKENRCKTKIDE